MADMRVHIAVGQQTNEMDLVLLASHDHLPGFAPYIAIAEGFFHLFGPLVEDATGTHDVVAHLGITHVGISRETHRYAMGMNGERNNWLAINRATDGSEEKWCSGGGDGIVGGRAFEPHTIKDGKNQWGGSGVGFGGSHPVRLNAKRPSSKLSVLVSSFLSRWLQQGLALPYPDC